MKSISNLSVQVLVNSGETSHGAMGRDLYDYNGVHFVSVALHEMCSSCAYSKM